MGLGQRQGRVCYHFSLVHRPGYCRWLRGCHFPPHQVPRTRAEAFGSQWTFDDSRVLCRDFWYFDHGHRLEGRLVFQIPVRTAQSNCLLTKLLHSSRPGCR